MPDHRPPLTSRRRATRDPIDVDVLAPAPRAGEDATAPPGGRNGSSPAGADATADGREHQEAATAAGAAADARGAAADARGAAADARGAAADPLSYADARDGGEPSVNLLGAGIGLARLTAGASWRVGRWGLGAGMRIGARVVQAAVDGETATTLLDDATHAIRDQARDLLGIVDDAGRIVGFQMPDVNSPGNRQLEEEAATLKALRAKGAALLDASADVNYDEPFHPAYARILEEMAPDEARILRLLAREGAQPAVDVRTYSPFPGGSELIAPGLNMIGAEAGLHYGDRVAAYLNNLERLGLVWFSREPLDDPLVYQVLEAQPAVLEALNRGRTKTVRRSIQITPFGQEFAVACIPLDGPH